MVLKKMKERILVVILSLAFLLTGVIGAVGISNAESNEKTITFSVFSDFHYDDYKTMTSIADLEEILERANDVNASFVLSAGDFSTDLAGSPELINAFHKNSQGLPTYNIYGNHETEGASLMEVTKSLTDSNVNWGDGTTGATFPSDTSYGYYYFDKDGFRVICTDSNYYCTDKTYEDDETYWKHYAEEEYGADCPEGYNNGINPAQQGWLEQVLTEAGENGIPCIVVSHHNLSKKYGSGNASQIRDIFTSVNTEYPGTIMMAISGHRHTNNMNVEGGILYFGVNSSVLGYYNENGTAHYDDNHTFQMVTYDGNGDETGTETKAIKDLQMGDSVWYRDNPLSAIVTISSSGVITIEGQESNWVYGIAPDPSLYAGINGVGTEISSGVFSLSDEERIISSYHTDISPYRETNNFTAPTLEGYTFAGWYKDKAFATALTANDKTGAAYAKFVPNYVLSVKAQVNQAALTDNITDNNRATLRLATSVDTLKFEKVGFIITRADDASYRRDTATNKVVETLSYVDKVGGAWSKITADQAFGACSKYFGVYTYTNIPESSVNTEITATPYWKTLDGTTVEGTQSVKTVDKGRSWIYVNETANADSLQYGTAAHPYTSIKTALNDILLKEGGKIWLQSDMEITGEIDLVNVNATVQSCDAANPATLYNNTSENAYVFDVSETGTLGLTDVIMDGRTRENAASGVASEKVLTMIRNLGTLKADNTTFQYSHNDYRGGAVYSKGNVIATNCKFIGNRAEQNSGALCIEGGTAKISGSEFRDNRVDYTLESTSGNIARGGAMWIVSGAEVEIEDTLFENNAVTTATDGTYAFGGAVFSEGTLTATDCQFKKNSSTQEISTSGHAGAVYINGADAKATFTKDDGEALFQENTATNWGGAIMLAKTSLDNVSINGYTFDGNSANHGGAIHLENAASGRIENATFTSNTVTGRGGAIDVNYANATTSELQIASSSFSQNTSSGGNGGALYLKNIKADLSDTTFTGNSAKPGAGLGGACYGESIEFTTTGGSFSSNNAHHGAALNISSGSTISLSGTNFSSNIATGRSGAIDTNDKDKTASEITIAGCTFDGNESGQVAGAACIQFATLNVIGATTFENNKALSATRSGGALYLNTAQTTIDGENILFNNNQTAQHGGAIYVVNANTDEEQKLVVSGAKFTGNTAIAEQDNAQGGAIHIGENVTAEFADVTFSQNVASTKTDGKFAYGGAIFSKGDLTATDCQFTNNTSTKETTNTSGGSHSGAVHISGADARAIFTKKDGEAIFEGNTAGNWGGAIILEKTVLDNASINGYTFSNNSANHGGAIHLEGAASGKIENATFTQNTVTGRGGAIDVNYSSATTAQLQIKKSTFTQNSGVNGGALYLNNIGVAITDSTNFTENEATTKGGAIYMLSTTGAEISNSTFSKNKATITGNGDVQGGAIYGSGIGLTITGGSFSNNEAHHGAAMSVVTSSEVTLDSVNFTENHSRGRSGVLDSNNTDGTESQFTFEDCSFTNNSSAQVGGAMCLQFATLDILGTTTFKNNEALSATRNGGALYLNTVDTEIGGTNVLFENNKTAVSGGAIYSTNSPVSILSGVTFKNNSSSGTGGGAIYMSSGSLSISDGASFLNNKANNTATWAGHGGAIYSSQTTAFTMTGGTFEGNTAACRGGAIYFEGSTATPFTITGGTFKYNSATQGGAIFTIRIAEASIMKNVTMEYNSVMKGLHGDGDAYGGAIYMHGNDAKLTLQNVNIANNTHKGGQLTAETVASKNTVGVDFVFGNVGTSRLYLADNSFTAVVTWKPVASYNARIYYNNTEVALPAETPTGQYVMDYTNSQLVTYTPSN